MKNIRLILWYFLFFVCSGLLVGYTKHVKMVEYSPGRNPPIKSFLHSKNSKVTSYLDKYEVKYSTQQNEQIKDWNSIQKSIVKIVNSDKDIPGTTKGTGFFIHPDGFIMTNYHVIDDGSDVLVTTTDQKLFWARKLNENPVRDIASLKIRSTDEPFNYFSYSKDKPKIGDEITCFAYSNLNNKVMYATTKISDISTVDNHHIITTNIIALPGYSEGPCINNKFEIVSITKSVTPTIYFFNSIIRLHTEVGKNAVITLANLGMLSHQSVGVF